MLMFADDVALMSDTVVGLQKQLNVLSKFCTDYKVKVNEAKTKLLFSRMVAYYQDIIRHEKWFYRNTRLKVVNNFCYVG
jgi:hypothetical protein